MNSSSRDPAQTGSLLGSGPFDDDTPIAELLPTPQQHREHRYTDKDQRPKAATYQSDDCRTDKKSNRLGSHQHQRPVEVVSRRLAIAEAAVLGVDQRLIGAILEAVADDPERVVDDRQPLAQRFEKSKADPEVHDFVKYLVNWVAGTKLIFIMLLIVILYAADDQTLIFAGVAMVISIASFFWRLFPLVRKMDREGQVDPPKYSVALGWMIAVFILVFLVAVLVTAFM